MNHENIDYSSYKIVFSYDFLYISIFGVKVDLRVELPIKEMIQKQTMDTILTIELYLLGKPRVR